jgi:hypothetical protein
MATENTTDAYRERLKQRQRQEYEDKGKTGLGRKSVLDFSRRGLGEVKIFMPQYLPAKNVIDILPFEISQSWYAGLRMFSGRAIGLPPGWSDYKLQVPVHRKVGANNDTLLCLREAFGGKCYICDEMFNAYKAGEKEKAKDLRPGWRCFYNIYNYDEPDKGIQLMEISYFTFEATPKNDPQRANLIDAVNLDTSGPVPFYDLEFGKTIIAEFKKKVLGKQEFPELSAISFEDREVYTDEIFRQVYPLDSMLIIPTPEEVKLAYLAYEDDEDSPETSGGQSAEKPSSSATSTTRGGRTRGAAPSSAPSSPPATGRTVGRGRQQTPAPEPEPELENQDDGPVCPAGKVFGRDCNSGPECEGQDPEKSCDNETFEACSLAFVQFRDAETKEKETPPASTRTERTRTTVGTSAGQATSTPPPRSSSPRTSRRVRGG